MAEEIKPEYIPKNLYDPNVNTGREGIQGHTSKRALRPLHERKSTSGTGFRETSAATMAEGAGLLPFNIYTYEAGPKDPSDLVVTGILKLLINPSDIGLGSSQVLSSQYGRDGHINSLWGSSQGTITGNGSSAAFLTYESGLEDTVNQSRGVSKIDSIAYANLMSFITLVRGNGYRHLVDGLTDRTGGPKENSGNTDPSITTAVKETGDPVEPNERAYPSELNASLGLNRTRVISVLDTLGISYGGTTYLGSFNSFTLEDDANSPFRFSYSFEFMCTGIKGDTNEGHLTSGNNHAVGIRNFIQGNDGSGVSLLSNMIPLRFDKINKELKEIRDEYESMPVPGSGEQDERVQKMIDDGTIRLKSGGVTTAGLNDGIIKALPAISDVFQQAAAEIIDSGTAEERATIDQWYPPLITSALDSNEHKKGSLHYEGKAIDVRSNYMPVKTRQKLVAKLAAKMKDYGIWVYYHPVGSTKAHFHMEYYPSKAAKANGQPAIGM